jgi:deoxyribodipyrimidine photolyase
MADVTIATEPPNGDQTAFAAGVAAATATQAAQEAEVAVEQAEQAAEQAEMAEVIAAEAAGEAYDARTEVGELRSQFTAFMDEMRTAVRPAEPVVVVDEPPTEPAPTPGNEGEGNKPPAKSAGHKPPADDKPPAEAGYGASWWFGGKR